VLFFADVFVSNVIACRYRKYLQLSVQNNRSSKSALTPQQLTFLSKVAAAIPRLFAALQEGNVKSELVLGLRRVRNRQARLKLVAELVDPGSNPLQTHGSRSKERAHAAKKEIKQRTN